ncbi:hypothetical protein HCH_02645 [Hahella chejuensis KCTC 2396]|uniref:Uncharacterized protein n=1 Tax=Hahella chejuensis (strain KCTC 2396) TaxID=349521 RepID=Q2SIU0_HAHCH|nr:hypothetical protein HCH_02645 [Hahella chejuensis KCTC 2396]
MLRKRDWLRYNRVAQGDGFKDDGAMPLLIDAGCVRRSKLRRNP